MTVVTVAIRSYRRQTVAVYADAERPQLTLCPRSGERSYRPVRILNAVGRARLLPSFWGREHGMRAIVDA